MDDFLGVSRHSMMMMEFNVCISINRVHAFNHSQWLATVIINVRFIECDAWVQFYQLLSLKSSSQPLVGTINCFIFDAQNSLTENECIAWLLSVASSTKETIAFEKHELKEWNTIETRRNWNFEAKKNSTRQKYIALMNSRA